MNPKFNPKFTIATSYSNMFSSAELSYIEVDILCPILVDPDFNSCEQSNSLGIEYFDKIETPTEFCHLVRDNESQWQNVIKQLEKSWELELGDHPQKNLNSIDRFL